MKVNLSIEIEVEDLPKLKGVPNATVDGLIGMIRLHTNMVTENYYGEVVKFVVEKDLDTTP